MPLDSYEHKVSWTTHEVLLCKERHKTTWRDGRGECRWFLSLLEEVCELGLAILGLHKDTVQHELIQIAAICMNWQEYHNELLIAEITGNKPVHWR